MSRPILVVDNRIFLLGLNKLYRSALKVHERGELLDCAKEVALDLDISPARVPIEGYYSEDESLTHYFRLMRALQSEHESRMHEVRNFSAYRRLKEITESPVYGMTTRSDYLIRRSQDALYAALETVNERNVQSITAAAYEIALESSDFSLVTLAALAQDAVVLAALRETAVLNAEKYELGVPVELEYKWSVDTYLEKRAGKFVREFNHLFGESLPRPCRQNAAAYFDACDTTAIIGRCVCIAVDDHIDPAVYYHWAIEADRDGRFWVSDFTDGELWTTDRFRRMKPAKY